MPLSKNEYKVCPGCGKKSERLKGEKPKLFCNRDCWRKRRLELWKHHHPPNREWKQCERCGKKYLPSPFIRWKSKYCGNRCKSAAVKKNTYWEKREQILNNDRKSLRKRKWDGNWLKALERDDHKCQFCGSQKRVLVHHKDGEGEHRKNNHALNNLQTICYQCHRDMHGISLVEINGKFYLRGNILKYFKSVPLEILYGSPERRS